MKLKKKDGFVLLRQWSATIQMEMVEQKSRRGFTNSSKLVIIARATLIIENNIEKNKNLI